MLTMLAGRSGSAEEGAAALSALVADTKSRSNPIPGTLVQAVFGMNFLRFDARSRLCAPRLGTGFAATVSRTPSPRIVEGPINSFHPSPSCSAAAQCADHPKHRR